MVNNKQWDFNDDQTSIKNKYIDGLISYFELRIGFKCTVKWFADFRDFKASTICKFRLYLEL